MKRNRECGRENRTVCQETKCLGLSLRLLSALR